MNIRIEGISTLALFCIPAVLALAAIWWLTFGEGLHYFRRALSQESRRAEVVGAKYLPSKPIKINITYTPRQDVVIDRAEIDGSDLWIYYKNVSTGPVSSIKFTYEFIAPDQTIVGAESGYISIYADNNAPDSLEAGQRGEAHLKVKADPRAVQLNVHMR